MRKVMIGSGLGLIAAAVPLHGAVLPIATEPAGVSEAGRISFADQGTDTQGVLIGLNKPGETQIKQQGASTEKFNTNDKFKSNSQIKMNPYDKMNAAAQLKIKGEYKFNQTGENQIKSESQIKSPGDSQLKFKSGDQLQHKGGPADSQIKLKTGDQLKYGGGGGEGIVSPNYQQPGQ